MKETRKWHAFEKPREREMYVVCSWGKIVIKEKTGCGRKELLPQETMCPAFFSHILKSMNLLLALSLFPIPCRPELTAKPLFYLKLFKACQKMTYPAESESGCMIAGTHLLITARPGDHHC